jgi:hypothetical protein
MDYIDLGVKTAVYLIILFILCEVVLGFYKRVKYGIDKKKIEKLKK